MLCETLLTKDPTAPAARVPLGHRRKIYPTAIALALGGATASSPSPTGLLRLSGSRQCITAGAVESDEVGGARPPRSSGSQQRIAASAIENGEAEDKQFG